MPSAYVTSAQQSQVSTPGTVVQQQFIVAGTSTNAVAIVTSTGNGPVIGTTASKPPIPPPPLRIPAVPPRTSGSISLPQPQKNSINNWETIDKQRNRNSLILSGCDDSEGSIGTISTTTISALGINNNSNPDQESTNNSTSLWITDRSEDKCGGIHQV